MGRLEKRIFVQFAEFECDRQLYLNLGKNDPILIDPFHKILPSARYRKRSHLATELGKKYEQGIYSNLKRLPQTRCTISQTKDIAKTDLTANLLNDLYDEIVNTPLNEICLLEHEFEPSRSFIQDLLLKPPLQFPNLQYSSNRPDIMILGNEIDAKNKKVRELLPDGTIKVLSNTKTEMSVISESEHKESVLKSDNSVHSLLLPRIGINIYDIKVSNEKSIGKKHFIEIFYYARALSHFLKETGLNSKFFVRVDSNGILPNIPEFHVNSLDEFRDLTVQIGWNDTNRIFINTVDRLHDLFETIPKDVSDINSLALNIKPSCGRCDYVEDCKYTLGYGKRLHPKDWDVRLLPNTSRAIAEQLIDRKMSTIGFVATKISTITPGSIPNPIYPQLPLLESKSIAISSKNPYFPKRGEVYSLAIPRYTDLILIFDNEYDPIVERVFAVGMHLYLSVTPKANRGYNDLFDEWWRIWKTHLKQSTPINDVKTELDDILPQDATIQKRHVKEISKILKDLWKNTSSQNRTLEITLPSEQAKHKDRTTVKYAYTYVNGGLADLDEAQLAKNTIEILYKLVKLCSYIEFYIKSPAPNNPDYFVSPSLAIFYWSTDQLKVIEEMLERNLYYLISDSKIRPLLEELITLFSPSESAVRDPDQHKKLYDLRVFAETVVGLPECVINYTWHEIAEALLNTGINRRFWMPHFNYMEFVNWHEYLEERDTNKRNNLRNEIRRQLAHKLRTINYLRQYFQINAKGLVSKKAKPVGSSEIIRRNIGEFYHPLANLWYIYSKLNGTYDEYEADYFRTMYPDFSIGKLKAAEVSKLNANCIPTARSSKYSYCFELHNLSTNMKINEGDHVLLIPYELRDINYTTRKWRVIIEQMEWKYHSTTKKSYYDVTTEAGYKNLLTEAENILEKKPEKWYLYPYSSDNWSSKLINGNGLLQRYNFGGSWLGHRLSYQWKLTSEAISLPHPTSLGLPEIYIYAPDFLPSAKQSNQPLLTQIDPEPDYSQKKAIKFALSSTISMIIGPPGTGKSQTIVALIDEFLVNNDGKPVKILITAFSYAALRVLIDKLQTSKYKNRNKTKAAKIQKVFLRSQSQEPNEPVGDYSNVKDLCRYGSTWKLDDQSRVVTQRSRLEDHLDDSFIILGNAYQLYHMGELRGRTFRCFEEDFGFDLIIVDEASQFPPDHFLSCLQFLKKNGRFKVPKGLSVKDNINFKKIAKDLSQKTCLTKLVIVGDHNQLPPVRKVKPPLKLKIILSSLFAYYAEGHKITAKQLEVNYRSHEDIVEYTSELGLYDEEIKAHKRNANRTITGNWQSLTPKWLRETLDPQKVVSTIIHYRPFDMAVSPFEAEITVKLILGYYKMRNPKGNNRQREFWEEEVGIVAPHNAHGRLIIRRIFEELIKYPQTTLDQDELMRALKAAIVSVEKFQGSDRSFIIASIGLSDKDQLAAEEEFIYDLNRFNVLTSRAKSKVILVCSKNYLDYLPKQRDVMEYSSKIRFFAMDFCNNSKTLQIQNEDGIQEDIEYRWRM